MKEYDPLQNPACRVGFWKELKESLLGSPRKLDCVQIEVSSFCPGRCLYCPHTTDRERWNSRHMAAETFARLWPLLRQSGRAHLQGWGEPLLNPRFFDFAAFARKAGCAVSTTTCGLRMDDDIAARLVDSGIDVVAFSLAGTDERSNAPRAGVDFNRVVEAIRTLQRIRRKKNGVHLEIHLAYLMLADSVEAVRGLPRLMDELDLHAAVISTLDYIPAPGMEALAFAPPFAREDAEKIETARAVLEETRRRVRAQGRDFYFALPGKAPAPQCRENTQRTVYVDADGNMSPCVYLNVPNGENGPKHCIFGNVRERDALDIWHDPAFAGYRARILTEQPPEGCAGCAKRFEMAG
ncbi:MAG TPA: radical SAM protein [Candidatus Mailhella merdavium]|nr:radical SAM protein [Candidatus Mailhella merdavium]